MPLAPNTLLRDGWLALTLPRALATARTDAGAAGSRWRPSTLNVLFFANSAIDGAFAFTLSLLFAGSLPLASALLAAGLILAFQRSASTVERLAAFATWVDSVLVVGPLMSGFFVARFGLPSLYQTLAVAMAVALVHLGARRRAA